MMSQNNEEILIHLGGLMRCCLATIDDYRDVGGLVDKRIGDVIKCKYCKSSIRLENDGWRWAKDLYHD